MRVYWHAQGPETLPRRDRVDHLLRSVLAPLVGRSAESLSFGRGIKGRPFLRHAGAPDFNLSDTAGGTVVAVCANGRVGVDLERLDRRPPVARLAARWFSGVESRVLATMEPEPARLAFLHLWTAKEASCKATGTGIFGFLDQWQFDAASAAPQLHAAPADAGDLARWRFLRLAPAPGHTAALALRDVAATPLNGYRLVG